MTRPSLTVYILDEGHSYADLGGGLVLTRTAKKGCRVIWSVEDPAAENVCYDGLPSASYVTAYMEALAEAEREARGPVPMDEDPPGTGRG